MALALNTEAKVVPLRSQDAVRIDARVGSRGIEHVRLELADRSGETHCLVALPALPNPFTEDDGAVRIWATAFDSRFLGLRGDLAATQRVAKEFKIYFEKRKTGETYTVDHSGQTYVLDPQGRLRLLVRPERLGQDLAPDLKALLGA